MKIKFCDNLCGICQGPILRPIASNISISGIDVLPREGKGERDSDAAGGVCSGEPARTNSCTWVGQSSEKEVETPADEKLHVVF